MSNLRKKQRTNVILLLFLIIIMVVAAVTINSKKEDEQSVDTQTGNYEIFDITEADIVKFDYTFKDQKFAFEKKDAEWIYTTDKNFPVATDRVSNQFINTVASISASRKVVDGKERLKDFGLLDPYSKVTIYDKEDKPYEFHIGDFNKILKLYYMYVPSEETVYMVDEKLFYIIREDIYDFAVLDVYPSFDIDSMVSFNIHNDDLIFDIMYLSKRPESDLTNSSKWYVGKPFQIIRGLDQNKLEEVVETMVDLEFTKTVNYKPTQDDLKEYGITDFNKSYNVSYREYDEITKETTNYEYKIIIGNLTDDEENYYVQTFLYKDMKVESGGRVSLMKKEVIDSIISIDPLSLMHKYAAYVKLDDIKNSNIEISTPNGNSTIEYMYKEGLKEDEVTEKLTLNNKEVDEKKIKDFYVEMIKLGADRIIYDRETIVDKEADYTIVYNRTLDDYYGKITVKFIEYNSSYYQVEVNGVVDFLTTKRKVITVFEQLDELIDSIK